MIITSLFPELAFKLENLLIKETQKIIMTINKE